MKITLRQTGAVIGRCFIIFGVTLLLLAAGLYFAMFIIVNGPSPTAGSLFVLSLKETSAGGFLADWYISEEEIADSRKLADEMGIPLRVRIYS